MTNTLWQSVSYYHCIILTNIPLKTSSSVLLQPGIKRYHETSICKSNRYYTYVVSPESNRLNIRIDNPAQLGADLVAGAVAAVAKYPLPCIIFDLGTATTISVIDEKGYFLGGTICAGVTITLGSTCKQNSIAPPY